MIKHLILVLFLSTLPALANTNIWAGYGVLGQEQEDHQRTNDNYKMFVWGVGESFWGTNLAYFESGIGMEKTLADGAKSRTSFLKVGLEHYFDLSIFYPYFGLGAGYIAKSTTAAKRSSNYSPNNNPVDYNVTGTKTRAALSRMYSGTFGVRFLNSIIDNISFDLNAISLIYNDGRYRRYSGLTVVYIFGGI